MPEDTVTALEQEPIIIDTGRFNAIMGKLEDIEIQIKEREKKDKQFIRNFCTAVNSGWQQAWAEIKKLW